jgi:hypothetical protein
MMAVSLFNGVLPRGSRPHFAAPHHEGWSAAAKMLLIQRSIVQRRVSKVAAKMPGRERRRAGDDMSCFFRNERAPAQRSRRRIPSLDFWYDVSHLTLR